MSSDEHERIGTAIAAAVIDPMHPPHLETMMRWHDQLKLPRDYSNRRIWTWDICRQVREARAKSREA